MAVHIERVGFYNPVAAGQRKARRAQHRARQSLGFQRRAADRQGPHAGQGSREPRPRPEPLPRAADARARRRMNARAPHPAGQGRSALLAFVAKSNCSRSPIREHATLKYQPWILRASRQRARTWTRLAVARPAKAWSSRFPAVTDRDAAEALHGAEIWVPRDRAADRPSPASITGSTSKACAWSTAKAWTSAPCRHLFETGANDVLVVPGERERLIPFVTTDFIDAVDFDAGKITVDWDRGLLMRIRRAQPVPGIHPRSAPQVGVVGRRGRARHCCRCSAGIPRDYADDNYRRVDDRPFGGGPGMVMMIEPLQRLPAAARAADRGAGTGAST